VNISLLCSSFEHPIYPYLVGWVKSMQTVHQIELVHTTSDLSGGDILFLISCNEIVMEEIRNNYAHSLVLHASDLPKGRGWSPHIWQILEGEKNICISLIEAEDIVDSGAIWKQERITIESDELYDEINMKIFKAELSLMHHAVENSNNIKPVAQKKIEASYYNKRSPLDSKINPEKNILEQFNLLRVSDPERYPAYFELNGFKYRIRIDKIKG